MQNPTPEGRPVEHVVRRGPPDLVHQEPRRPAKRDMAVVPDSNLARLLSRLGRHDRRELLAAIQAAPGPRRDRLERRVQARLAELGLTPQSVG